MVQVGQVMLVNPCRTNGVIVLQSGRRLPAAIVHGDRHQNGKGQVGPPQRNGP